MTTKTNIVLVGGGSMGPWTWERVAPILEADGYHVLAVQLRATGNDATPPSEVSLRDWVDDLCAALTELEPSETVLVAHSFAGYVAAAALDRDPQIARMAVFLDAVLPSPGLSWFDQMGSQTQAFMTSLQKNGAIPFFTQEQLDGVYPGHGLSDDDWVWMQGRITAQPIGTYTQSATRKALDAEGAVKLAYVRCDRTVPPVADIDEATPGWTVRTLPTGHWPMITDPIATASAIEELAGQ